jgi:hypothetical protein
MARILLELQRKNRGATDRKIFPDILFWVHEKIKKGMFEEDD